MPTSFPVTENVVETGRHTTFYLACGAEDAPLIIFVHGWPELSISWRHQLPCMASLGFRAIAPDMRGYGRSSVHPRHEDYALEHIVEDMLELLGSLGAQKAVWVGHDWGSPVVWSLASHHAGRCHGVANLCVPYHPHGFRLESVVPLVDRALYPEEQYPAGQWEYRLYYEENFEKARAAFEANVAGTVAALFRKGKPEGKGRPARTAETRRQGGWFPGAGQAPSMRIDTDVISKRDFQLYVDALQRNGFFGPDAWYMNDRANHAYGRRGADGGRLRMPVLFLHADHDYTCETVTSRLAEPMRACCDNLTEGNVASGHWMAQEQPVAVNSALSRWLAAQFPQLWSPMLRQDP